MAYCANLLGQHGASHDRSIMQGIYPLALIELNAHSRFTSASCHKELRSLQREGSHGWCGSYVGGVDSTASGFATKHQLCGVHVYSVLCMVLTRWMASLPGIRSH